MKKIILIILLLALPLVCFAQDVVKTQPLALTIKSDKQVYGVGEEMKIVVTLRNNSNKEMIVYWPKGEPAIASKETNVFTVIVDASKAAELIYIKPTGTFEKNIHMTLKNNLIAGQCSITLEYVAPMEFDHIFNIEKQEIWSYPLTSNTIQIEVVGKEEDKITKEEAISIAQKVVIGKKIDLDKYYIKSIEEFNRNGKDVWFLTFDLKEKLQQRKSNRPITKGGEIFVDIDKNTGEAVIRFGE